MLNIELIMAIVGALGTVVGVIWGIVTFFLPSFQEYKNKKYLEDKLGRGPYDTDTIQRATEYYIRPRCSNMDPSVESEPRYSAIDETDLISVVDFFLQKDNSHRHLLLLADSGMGKSSFVLNYYAYNAHLSKRKKQKISIVPLGIPNVNDWIQRAKASDDSVIILDAFDEDIAAIDNFKKRIEDLMEMCQGFKKVIITCRTQFFQKDSDIPSTTGLLRIGPTSVDENKYYEFKRYYLLPFNNKEVKQYINKRYSFWMFRQKQKAMNLVYKMPLLSVRPMLLAHIPDLLVDNKEFDHSYQIYEAMIDAWIKRESFVENKNDLRNFSNQLAVDLYINSDIRGAERIPYNQLSALASQWGISVAQWKLSSRSLLNRDSEGNYKFAHRSIMEYLFVKQLTEKNEACNGVFLTDQMMMFLKEILNIELMDIKFNKIAVIDSSVLLRVLLGKGIDDEKVDSRLDMFTSRIAKGLAWNKISSALFLKIDSDISQIDPGENYFKVSDWRQIEERLAFLVVNDGKDAERNVVSRQIRNLLVAIPKTSPRVLSFEEVPRLTEFIARFLDVIDLDIDLRQMEHKIDDLLKDESIYFWGESDEYWNPWYRIHLFLFLSEFGMDALRTILINQNSSLVIPLFNEKHLRSDGFVMIIK